MSDEYIKKSEATAIAEELLISVSGYEQHNQAIMSYETELQKLPSADVVERKRGEWIEQEDCWQCSECGDEYVLEVDVKPIDAKMYYCPNCGARMKGADDETD